MALLGHHEIMIVIRPGAFSQLEGTIECSSVSGSSAVMRQKKTMAKQNFLFLILFPARHSGAYMSVRDNLHVFFFFHSLTGLRS